MPSTAPPRITATVRSTSASTRLAIEPVAPITAALLTMTSSPPNSLDGAVDGAGDVVLGRDVGGDGDRSLAELGRHRLGGGGHDVGDDDGRAVLDEAARHRRADPAAGAGDDGDAAVEPPAGHTEPARSPSAQPASSVVYTSSRIVLSRIRPTPSSMTITSR